MLIKKIKDYDIRPSEITSKSNFYNRRRFLKNTLLAGGVLGAGAMFKDVLGAQEKFDNLRKSRWTEDQIGEKLTSYKDITRYNNFYEFGPSKTDPAKYAKDFKSKPWTIEVGGFCEYPGTYGYEDFIDPLQLEDRVYRFRCVEAWSMVVPWVGIPLVNIVKRFNPTSKAKYIAFETLFDPGQMPGQQTSILQWPYREALRIDEAVHPLTLIAVGIYGEALPNQNGAPIRLVVPWKYGFKSIKSIVRIEFTDKMPLTSWSMASPKEYGFFSNVNPNISHPRWSQARERRIGEFFKRPTLMFNGYSQEVEQLYAGMDLKTYF